MESIARFFMLVLVSYRVSEIISVDDGPYDIFLRLRVGSARMAVQGSNFWRNVSNLLHCPFCVGIWISFIISPFYFIRGTFMDFIFLAIAIAGAQCFMEGLHPRKHNGI